MPPCPNGHTEAALQPHAIGVPSYDGPGPAWDTAVAAAPGVRYLVLNPDSGPGVAPDPFHVARAARASAAGICVMGYVHTAWGMRDEVEVRRDVARFREWYGVTSTFFDEAATAPGLAGWYGGMAAEVRSGSGGVVALNHGTWPAEAYAAVADVLVVFEGPWSVYRMVEVPPWVLDHPARSFWHLVHATPAAALVDALDRARSLNAGTVYVTDHGMPNPWDRLPTYWDREVAAVAAHQLLHRAG